MRSALLCSVSHTPIPQFACLNMHFEKHPVLLLLDNGLLSLQMKIYQTIHFSTKRDATVTDCQVAF